MHLSFFCWFATSAAGNESKALFVSFLCYLLATGQKTACPKMQTEPTEPAVLREFCQTAIDNSNVLHAPTGRAHKLLKLYEENRRDRGYEHGSLRHFIRVVCFAHHSCVNALWRQLLFCCSWSRCLVFKYVQNRWGKRCSSYVDLIYHVWWLKHMFLYIVIWTLPFLTWFNSSFWF